MQNTYNIYIKSIAVTFVIAMLFSCKGKLNEVRSFELLQDGPQAIGQEINLFYTDSGKVVANLKSAKLKDYSNQEFPYREFPDGLTVDFFDDSKIQNLVNAYLKNPPNITYENILFPLLLNGLKESHVRERVENMVAKVGLMDQIIKKPAQLSGGQCQRVAIARALVKDPLLILADEPTANLDSENSHQILELMRELNHEYKAAVIFSTHDEKVTRYIRREVRLEDGRVSSDQRRNGREIET